MSSLSRPRGRLPARVYWFRRALVLAVALGLVAGVAHLLGGGGGGGGQAARTVAAQPSASVTTPAPTTAAPTPTRTPAPPTALPSDLPTLAADGTVRRAGKHRKVTLAVPEGTCRDRDVLAAPSVKGRASGGRLTVFRLTLVTRSAPACTWTVSPDSLVLRVDNAGGDRVWTSQQCPGAIPREEVVVRRDVATTVTAAWNGMRSDEECSHGEDWLRPGDFEVTAAAYGSDPLSTSFTLRKPPRSTETRTPKPSGKQKRALAAEKRHDAALAKAAARRRAAQHDTGAHPKSAKASDQPARKHHRRTTTRDSDHDGRR